MNDEDFNELSYCIRVYLVDLASDAAHGGPLESYVNRALDRIMEDVDFWTEDDWSDGG